MIHKTNDTQAELLEAIKAKKYKKMEPQNSPSGSNYMTFGGITFTWLHGLSDGKTIKIEDKVQPEWFARQVRELLAK